MKNKNLNTYIKSILREFSENLRIPLFLEAVVSFNAKGSRTTLTNMRESSDIGEPQNEILKHKLASNVLLGILI